jgi:uncharacterized MAPEG superfamily protein
MRLASPAGLLPSGRSIMTTELTMLAWSVVLGLLHAVTTGQFTTLQHGIRYGLSPRDEERKLTGIGARVQRAFANYMQTFPFFAAAVLVAHLADRHSWLTTTGAQLFFWARLAYVPLYAAGIPIARTVAFVIATAGIVFILIALT